MKHKGFNKFIIFTIVYAIFLMWVSGTINHYFPTPIPIGGGQYLDLSIGVLIIGGAIFIMIANILYKKIKKPKKR